MAALVVPNAVAAAAAWVRAGSRSLRLGLRVLLQEQLLLELLLQQLLLLSPSLLQAGLGYFPHQKGK